MATSSATSSADAPLSPEGYAYRDTGCHLNPKCLDCPLPQCFFDSPQAYHAQLRQENDQLIAESHFNTYDGHIQRTADAFRITSRTVFRAIARVHEAASQT